MKGAAGHVRAAKCLTVLCVWGLAPLLLLEVGVMGYSFQVARGYVVGED